MKYLKKIGVLFIAVLMVFGSMTILNQKAYALTSIDSSNATVTAQFTDEGDQPITEDSIVGRDQKIKALFTINYKTDGKPTGTNNEYIYKLPSEITFDEKSEAQFFDDENQLMGTYKITQEGIILKYDEAWLSNADNSSLITTKINFDFKVNKDNASNKTTEIIQFPGVSSSLDFNLENVKTNGEKYGSVDQNGNINFTIKLKPDADLTNLNITDTLGSNLSFVDGSFKLDGTPLSGVTIDQQVAKINIGTMNYEDSWGSPKEHYITYSATVKDATQYVYDNTNNSSATISNTNNTANWTYDFGGDNT